MRRSPARRATALLLLAGCGGGGFDATRIDDVHIVTVVTEPAEASPGEQVQADVYVANSQHRDLEIMFWTCLYYEDSCLEATLAEEVEEWVTIGSVVDGRFTTSRQIPSDAWEYLTQPDTIIPVQLYVLACQVGRCDVIDEVREAMDARGISDITASKLEHPENWMDDLPMGGLALATRRFRVSNRSPSSRNQNPWFDARFAEALDAPLKLDAGGEVDLAFAVADPNGETVYAFPFTTAGSFEDRKVKVDDDEVRLYMQNPDEATTGQVWVVFDDRDGGLAVYNEDWETR